MLKNWEWRVRKITEIFNFCIQGVSRCSVIFFFSTLKILKLEKASEIHQNIIESICMYML